MALYKYILLHRTCIRTNVCFWHWVPWGHFAFRQAFISRQMMKIVHRIWLSIFAAWVGSHGWRWPLTTEKRSSRMAGGCRYSGENLVEAVVLAWILMATDAFRSEQVFFLRHFPAGWHEGSFKIYTFFISMLFVMHPFLKLRQGGFPKELENTFFWSSLAICEGWYSGSSFFCRLRHLQLLLGTSVLRACFLLHSTVQRARFLLFWRMSPKQLSLI